MIAAWGQLPNRIDNIPKLLMYPLSYVSLKYTPTTNGIRNNLYNEFSGHMEQWILLVMILLCFRTHKYNDISKTREPSPISDVNVNVNEWFRLFALEWHQSLHAFSYAFIYKLVDYLFFSKCIIFGTEISVAWMALKLTHRILAVEEYCVEAIIFISVVG